MMMMMMIVLTGQKDVSRRSMHYKKKNKNSWHEGSRKRTLFLFFDQMVDRMWGSRYKQMEKLKKGRRGNKDGQKVHTQRCTYRPKGTGFDPRLDHKRCSTWATNSFSMWDNKDLLIVDYRFWSYIYHLDFYGDRLFPVHIFSTFKSEDFFSLTISGPKLELIRSTSKRCMFQILISVSYKQITKRAIAMTLTLCSIIVSKHMKGITTWSLRRCIVSVILYYH
jgi:hypothetical protein